MKQAAAPAMQEASGQRYENTYLRNNAMVIISFHALYCFRFLLGLTYTRDPGATPFELLALLLLADPDEVTLQKLLLLPTFGDNRL
jgi:hypothetical protein